MRKVIIGIFIAVLVIGGLVLAERSLRQGDQKQAGAGVCGSTASPGKVLPGCLKVKNIATDQVMTLDQLKGKVVLVNFWATWCEACMVEMPSIQKLYSMLKDEGFEVVGVNVDENPKSVVPGVVKKLGLGFQNYIDVNGELSSAFDVVAIPFSIVVDRDQNVVWSESGERDWASESVVAEIRKLLSKDGR